MSPRRRRSCSWIRCPSVGHCASERRLDSKIGRSTQTGPVPMPARLSIAVACASLAVAACGGRANLCTATNPCMYGTNGCPDDLGADVPVLGAPCTTSGLTCSGYGTHSCAETATCAADGTWRITCQAFPSGGAVCGPCTQSDVVDPDRHGCPVGALCDCTENVANVVQCSPTTLPACPAAVGSGQACALGAECFDCSDGVAGMSCTCSDALDSDGGSEWVCIGTEHPCVGP
jgi:hypothetical protein